MGKRGILRVSNYTVEAFEAEDHLIISAFDSREDNLHDEIARKLFALSAEVMTGGGQITDAEHRKLEGLEQESVNLLSARIAERNGGFFDAEVDKLDKWADDMKKALELDLKKLEIDIKAEKTNAKKIANLEEKVKVQRGIRDMERRRNEMRKRLYEAQDDVELKKEQLIERVETQLRQKSRLEPLFAVRWRVE